MPINKYSTALSIYPTARGFSFVLFDGVESPHDWGTVDVLKKDGKAVTILDRTQRLIDTYFPDLLIIEKLEGSQRRADYLKPLYQSLKHLAESYSVRIVEVEKSEVVETFAKIGVSKKHDIAKVIASELPKLRHLLPPKRRFFESDHRNQGIFDAAAIALACYSQKT